MINLWTVAGVIGVTVIAAVSFWVGVTWVTVAGVASIVCVITGGVRK